MWSGLVSIYIYVPESVVALSMYSGVGTRGTLGAGAPLPASHQQASLPASLYKFKLGHPYYKSYTTDVGLVRAVPPTNTNIRLSFLLIRLQDALYEDLHI